ncbi:MAG: DNA-directed RNA polymerase subunit P [Candidatus Woesearchaeota archaeon]|jgi:DNA-directed RNA polymerase subunit RPC12/RpoP|nr:DNA-directed RNA polymerase subunit P [Candidatus Woesearchaeota archaeon]
MVEYVCSVCKKTVNGVLVERKIRCPYCSSKALEKKQDRVLDIIKAR